MRVSCIDQVALLSATPINLKNEDLFALLTIVDPDNFRYGEQFQSVLKANEPLVKARLVALTPDSSAGEIREELEHARTYHLLRESKQLQSILSELLRHDPVSRMENSDRVALADRIERVNLLSRAVTRTRKVEVTEGRVLRDAKVQYVQMSAEETNLYNEVTNAVRQYAEDRDTSTGFLLAMPQRQLSSCMYAAAQYWRAASSDDSEELLNEDLGYSEIENRSEFWNHLVSHISRGFSLKSLRANDSKFTAFSKILTQFVSDYPTEKVVVFSYFRATLRYLHERLNELKIESRMLMGGIGADKNEIIEEFRTNPRIRALLSSEIASEGVDLQFSRFLINYDLPWNPMKVEQRIGRLDRLGQNAEKISIWNLVYDDTIDSRILSRLHERLKLFEKALGGMEAVIGEEIQSLTRALLTGRLTPEEEESRISQTALALENRRMSEEELERQASHLIAHSGYILQKVHAAHDFSKRITEDDLVSYVRDYLNRHATGHTFWQPGEDINEVDIKLPPANAGRFETFLRRRRLTGLTRLATGETRRCRFVNRVQKPVGPVELISQFHPLVRFIAQEIEKGAQSSIGLMCVRMSSSAKLRIRLSPGTYGAAVYRWVFEGVRTEELLRARVLPMGSTKGFDPEESLNIVNCARLEGRDWLEAANDVDSSAAVNAMDQAEFLLSDDFESERAVKEAENADRIEFQRHAIRAHLDRKLEIEERRIASLGLDAKNRGLVVATGRKIEELRKRFNLQNEKLTHREVLTSRPDLVCKCLILVEE